MFKRSLLILWLCLPTLACDVDSGARPVHPPFVGDDAGVPQLSDAGPATDADADVDAGPDPGDDQGPPDAGAEPLPCELDPDCASAPEFDFAEFDRMMLDFIAEKGYEGASVSIVHRDHGEVYRRGYGSFHEDRVVLVASGTKLMTATVFGRMHTEGLIDIFAPIGSFMPNSRWEFPGWQPPRWVQGWDRDSDIHRLNPLMNDFTIADAIGNRSGMPLLPLTIVGGGGCSYMSSANMRDCGQGMYNLMPEVPSLPVIGRFNYGGAQWQVAGAVAEEHLDTSWDTLVRDTFEKCNMGHYGYTNPYIEEAIRNVLLDGGGTISDIFNAAIGGANGFGFLDLHTLFDQEIDVDNPPRTQNPQLEGGAYSDAYSLAQVVLLQLREGMCDGGRVLSPEVVREMQRGRPGYPGVGDYGLGMWVTEHETGTIRHSLGAFGATPWFNMERGYGGAIMLEGSALDGQEAINRGHSILAEVFAE